MSKNIRDNLVEFYKTNNIYPTNFNCKYQNICRSYAYQGKMTETKMSMVGSRYGEGYPKIVVISLDPPLGNFGRFANPNERTTEYISNSHEQDNYTLDRPNVHWAMTQIIVKDILSIYGFNTQDDAAVVIESYAGRPIENVSAYFAHVNVAKCSMNNPGKGQAARKVHEICSNAYLKQEMIILDTDILVTQGKITNEIVGKMLINKPVNDKQLPVAFKVRMNGKRALWLPMRHPSRQVSKIRKDWLFYDNAIREWAKR